MTHSRDRGEQVMSQTEKSINSSINVLFSNLEKNAKKNLLRLTESEPLQEVGGRGRDICSLFLNHIGLFNTLR